MEFLKKLNFKYLKLFTIVMLVAFSAWSIYTAFMNMTPLVLTLIFLGLLQLLNAGEDFLKGLKRNAWLSVLIAVIVYVFMGYVIYLFV